MEIFNTKDLVSELVPHKGKMLLLDCVCNYDFKEVKITTEVHVTRDSLFYDENLGGVPVWVAFEYMAQSISALSGLYGRSKGEAPKLGFIMSVSSFNAKIPVFKDGETVTVTVHETVRMDAAVTFDGSAMVGETLAATATLNTVEVDDPQKTLGLN
jgi:predicted hotdog family 3-hydroxylacyl-ACP dehydratase